MPGKILIVDGVAINRIALKIRMNAAFYEVIAATSQAEALRAARDEQPDLILMNTRLANSSGLEACARLKASDKTRSIPVVLIAATPEDCKTADALRSGADDLLIKPLNDAVTLARIRSLLRARNTGEELRLHEGTSRALGFGEPETGFENQAQALVVTADEATGQRWKSLLSRQMPYRLTHACFDDALRGIGGPSAPDVFVLMLTQQTTERGMQLLAEIRARAGTREAGILLVLEGADPAVIVDALDRGANDVMGDGPNIEEMALRLSALVSRKRMIDRLRSNIHDGLQAAVIDPLTELFNRRYAMPQLAQLAETARDNNRSFSIMVADLDHFKQINDRFGHAAGDAVLIEVARRLRDNLRPTDLIARIGGEEFLIAIPNATLETAREKARRLCALIAETPIHIPEQDLSVHVTISIGVVIAGEEGQPAVRTATTLLDMADKALFGAKARGRNQVTLGQTAT